MKTDSTPSPTSSTPPRASRAGRRLRRAGISLVGLTSAAALFYAVENHRGARAWSSAIADLKAAGAKLSPADFADTPLPDEQNMIMHPAFRCFTFTRPDGVRARRLKTDKPDEEDAAMAVRWEALEKDLDENHAMFYALLDLWDTPKPEAAARRTAVENLRPLLARHEELLEAVNEACLRPETRWPLETGPGGGSMLDWLNSWLGSDTPGSAGFLRKLTRVAGARAYVLSTDGDTDNAWRQAKSAGRIALLRTGGMPTVGSQIFAAGNEGEEIGIVARLLEDFSSLPSRYADYGELLAARPGLTDSLAAAVEGDRAVGAALFGWSFQNGDNLQNHLTIMKIGGVDVSSPWMWLLPDGWFRQNGAMALKADNGMLEALRSGSSPAARSAAFSTYLEREEASNSGSVYGQLAHSKAAVYKNIGRAFLTCDTRRILLRTALLAAQHRAATGQIPLSPDELSPELKARVPRGPMHEDTPVISRDSDGVWTLSCLGYGDPPNPENAVTLRIRGW